MTGHLCSVTYAEAVEAGIDDLEHGFFVNTAIDPGQEAGHLHSERTATTRSSIWPRSPTPKRLIALLVRHHVAVTSTLVSAASVFAIRRCQPEAAGIDVARAAPRGISLRPQSEAVDPANSELRPFCVADMDLERAFVAAGGLLMAGADPVGLIGSVPGFADQREIELLVEAGFSPVQAIRIAT